MDSSSLRNSLWILDLCFNTIKTANISPVKHNSRGALKYHNNIGKIEALIIDARDTNLKIKKIINQTNSAMPSDRRISFVLTARAVKPPKLTAIPFPPLNFKKIVQTCPQKTKANMNIL